MMQASRKKVPSARMHSASVLFKTLILSTLITTVAQSAGARTAGSDNTRSDNNAPSSQDGNHDSADQAGPYDTGSASETHEDETGETSALPAPNELSVIRLNDTSVVLRWEYPDSSQEHLQFFKVQHRPMKPKNATWTTGTQEISPNTRAYQINGLRPGNFRFSVIAVYDNDDNISSEPLKYRIRSSSKIQPTEMPEMKAPEIYWSETKPDYFRFKWKYEPKVQDQETFGYLVYYRSAHTVSDFIIYNTMDSNVEVTELDADTPYEAKVVAYNTVGVSHFSNTIILRTEARSNGTSPSLSTIAPHSSTSSIVQAINSVMPSSSTRRPLTVSWPASDESRSTTPIDMRGTTQMPTISIGGNTVQNVTNSSVLDADRIYKSIRDAFNAVLGDQNDTMLIIRYLLLVMLPIMLIVIVLACLLRGSSPGRKRQDSPPSSTTDDSMQFDLEINGYFKNSFPGVEQDFPPVTNHNDLHHAFVNNHPHISDFA